MIVKINFLNLHYLILTSLLFLFISCNNTSTTDNAQQKEEEKKEAQQEAYQKKDGIKEINKCLCPIEKIDHYVENIDEEAQTFIDTFSIEGAMGLEGSVKYIGEGKVEGSAKDMS